MRRIKTVVMICNVLLVSCICCLSQQEVDRADAVAEDKIMNVIEEKDIAFEAFSFQPEERVLCIYEGEIELGTINEVFAIYKETMEKDIIFVNILFIEKETDSIWTWREEELVQIGTLEDVKSVLTNSSPSIMGRSLMFENMTKDKLLDRAMDVLKQTGCIELNLIYDGTIEFLHRNYHMVSVYDDYEDHIIRTQCYYIDCENGYMYRVGENTEFLRTELYFIGNL